MFKKRNEVNREARNISDFIGSLSISATTARVKIAYSAKQLVKIS